jgi:hypothetical protein
MTTPAQLPDQRIRIGPAIDPGCHQQLRALVRAGFDGLEVDLATVEVRIRTPRWESWWSQKFDAVAYDGVPLWRIPPSRIGRLRWALPAPANRWTLTRRLARLDPTTRWLVVLTVPADVDRLHRRWVRVSTWGELPDLVMTSGLEYLLVIAAHTAHQLATLQAERRRQEEAEAAPDRWAATVLDSYRRMPLGQPPPAGRAVRQREGPR